MGLHTINLPCVADTYIDRDNMYTNYGAVTSILIGDRNPGGGFTYFYKKGLFKFDLTSVPVRKNITQALLRLYVTDKNNDQGGSIRSGFTSHDFIEGTATYETNDENPYPESYRAIGGVQAGQYQDFGLSLYYGLKSNCVITINSSGTPPIYAYMHVASREAGSNPPLLVLTYEDVPPSKPALNGPVGSFEVKSAAIRFSWNYISSVGGVQKGFDLQWSVDQVNWSAAISQVTANNYYDMPAGTLPAGNIYWRVRTYNEYDEVSEYSDIAAFYAIGAPETPIIQSVTNTTRPTISWSSANQQVYQVQLLNNDSIIFDSGLLPGIMARSYKVPVYLGDGTYDARVRIKNEYDLLSEWGLAEFTLDIVRPEQPVLSLATVRYGIAASVSNISGVDDVLVYRSEKGQGQFICIGAADGGAFTDFTCASGLEYEYFARALINEAFTDSAVISGVANLKHNLFATVSDLSDIVELKFNLNSIPGKSMVKTKVVAAVHLSGRRYPVTEFSEHDESSISFNFAVRDYAEVKAVHELIDREETILFRDGRGRKIYGTLQVINETDIPKGTTLSFSLVQTDYDEEVEA